MWPASARQSDTLLDAFFAVPELTGQAAHAVSGPSEPSVELYVSMGQSRQGLLPVRALNVPAAQTVHASASAPVFPASQVHSSIVEASFVSVVPPKGHAVQFSSNADSRLPLYLPATHPVHDVSVLVAVLYCPAEQPVHKPEDARCPGPHDEAAVLEHGQTRSRAD